MHRTLILNATNPHVKIPRIEYSNTVTAEIGQFESGDSQAQQIKYGKIVRSGSFVFHSFIHMYYHIHKYI